MSIGKKINIAEKGFLDILLMLESGEKSFSELKTIGFSPNTILLRLREAQRVGLVKEVLFCEKDKKPKIKYTLTQLGRDILTTYLPVKDKYLNLKDDIVRLEKEAKSKQMAIKLLLASVSKYKDTKVHGKK